MLGRFTACLLCILVTVLFSLKQMGVTEAERNENHICFALESFMCDMEKRAVITLEDINELQKNISLAGMVCDLEIEIGTVLYGREDSTIELEYTGEILKELSIPGKEIDLKNRMITVRVIPKIECLGAELANMLWKTYMSQKEFVTGGFIHG